MTKNNKKQQIMTKNDKNDKNDKKRQNMTKNDQND